MTLIKKYRKLAWLMLFFTIGLAIWFYTRTPRLQLVEQYPFSYPVAVLSNGFLLWDTTGSSNTAIFRDWTGRECWRVNGNNNSSASDTDISPDGRRFVWVETTDHGLVITKWRDGKRVLYRTLKKPGEHVTWVEIRNDGTAWIAGCTNYTLHLYALRNDSVLYGEVHLPRTLPGSTIPVEYKGSTIFDIPACELMPNATILHVAANAEDGIDGTFHFPKFLTYNLKTTNNKLSFQLIASNTTNVKYETEKYYDNFDPSIGHITSPSSTPWTIPIEYPFYSSGWDHTPDGRYALIARVKPNYLGTIFGYNVQRFIPKWLTPKTYHLTFDLYERPGIVRAHSTLTLPIVGGSPLEFKAVHLAPDGRAALITIRGKVYLFKR